jgi:hypothetical protein
VLAVAEQAVNGQMVDGVRSRVEIEDALTDMDEIQLKELLVIVGVTNMKSSAINSSTVLSDQQVVDMVCRLTVDLKHPREEVLDAIVFDLCGTVEEGQETLKCAFGEAFRGLTVHRGGTRVLAVNQAPLDTSKLKVNKSKASCDPFVKLGRNALLTLIEQWDQFLDVKCGEMSTVRLREMLRSKRGSILY